MGWAHALALSWATRACVSIRTDVRVAASKYPTDDVGAASLVDAPSCNPWCRIHGLERPSSLRQFVHFIDRNRTFEALHETAPGPSDLQPVDGRGFSDTDVRAQARRAETPAAADVAVDLPLLAVFGNVDVDSRSDGEAIGFDTNQPQLDPVVAVARILVKHAPELVVGIDPAHHFENVLVACVVDVAKGDPMSLLQVAEPPRGRH